MWQTRQCPALAHAISNVPKRWEMWLVLILLPLPCQQAHARNPRQRQTNTTTDRMKGAAMLISPHNLQLL